MCTDRALPLVLAGAVAAGCAPEPQSLGTAPYASLGYPRQCNLETRPGPAGATDGLLTSRRVPYRVRTPANYDAQLAHPMLMVFAPAGFSAATSEQHAKITTAATAAGFVVAFADHRPLGYRAFDALAEVPAAVAARWCIDANRVTFAGHSDGATTALALGFLGKGSVRPASLVASAAGIRGEDLARYRCPAPMATLIVHSREDDHFPIPAYGREAAKWWARCNRCTGESAPDTARCTEYLGCAAPTRYCEVDGPHARWPGLREKMLGFATQPR